MSGKHKVYLSKLVSQKEATNQAVDRFELNRNREWGLYGADTGLHALNLLIGGWIPGKVTTIGGRSGHGKTALTVPMFQAGTRTLQGRRPEFLFLSWEMEPSNLVDRHVCSVVGITSRELLQGAKLIGPKKLDKITDAYNSAASLPVKYQLNSTNIAEVMALTKRFCEECRERGISEGVTIQPVIVIDYLGMAKYEGSGIRTYGIGDFVNGCKSSANETGASFCIFTQIGRQADEKDMPSRLDFADSQSIEMASDNLVVIHRPEYNFVHVVRDPETNTDVSSENKMLIRVLKGRDFGIGDRLINCNIKYYRFWEQNHTYEFPYWEMYSDKDFWLKHFGLADVNKEKDLKLWQ